MRAPRVQDGGRRQPVLRRAVLLGGTRLRRPEHQPLHGLPGLLRHRCRPPRSQRHRHGGQDRRPAPGERRRRRRRRRRRHGALPPVVPGAVRRHGAEAARLRGRRQGRQEGRGHDVPGGSRRRGQAVRGRVPEQQGGVAGDGGEPERVHARQARRRAAPRGLC